LDSTEFRHIYDFVRPLHFCFFGQDWPGRGPYKSNLDWATADQNFTFDAVYTDHMLVGERWWIPLI